MQILIVDDEKKLANVLRRGLLEEGYAVDLAFDGDEALEKFEINMAYDAIVLDLMIPKTSGMAVLKKIRQSNADVPIIILTARTEIDDRIAGLDEGADDYLTKPFSFGELTARIRALLRRGNKADPPQLSIDTLALNPANHVVKRGKREITLTAREYALLEYFMRNQNKLLTKTQILEHVWDYNYDGLSNIVETYVKYLRKKIRTVHTDRELIHTMRGSGYIMKLE